VGRLSIQKNADLFIDAIDYFVKHYNDVKIIVDLVGDGALGARLRKKVKYLDLTEVVIFRGAIVGKNLEEIYNDSDIFVLTSAHESFGNVLIEAMAKGLPIVATKIPAVRNIVREKRNALLTESTPTSVAASIRKIITSRELYQNMSANNLHDAKKYTWEKTAERFLETYKNGYL
jgi:glycosyltransferase involved in cell wall biosynthesis